MTESEGITRTSDAIANAEDIPEAETNRLEAIARGAEVETETHEAVAGESPVVETTGFNFWYGEKKALHDINMAARYCDHLTALHGGRVLEQGAPVDMMESDTLEAIYGLPMQIMRPSGSPHPIAVVQ